VGAPLKKKKEYKFVLRAAVISALKRIFIRSPIFSVIKEFNKRERIVKNKDGSASKARRVEYQCNGCKEWFPEKINKETQVAVDHILPVIEPTIGYVDFNTWIEREFVEVQVWDPKINSRLELYNQVKHRLQLLCNQCHGEKSLRENIIRREVKKTKVSAKAPDKKKSGNKNQTNIFTQAAKAK